MKPKVYLETSVISYLASKPSRDLIIAGHQQLTRDWWDQQSNKFQLYISGLVFEEVKAGDLDAANRRLELIATISMLELNQSVLEFTSDLIEKGIVPPTAVPDATHIALAVVHGIDYLLTWNCRHIANARIRARILDLVRKHNFKETVICTSEELMEESQ